jgi:uncharacterized protein with FMN-binding domain
MSTLMRRAAPGVALATVTLGAVWWVDPAFDSAVEPAEADPAGSLAIGKDTAGADRDPEADPDPEAAVTPESADGCDVAQPLTGDPVHTQWGPVQVQMDVAPDGTICAARAVAYPADDTRSARISAWAIPELDARAPSQGVDFDALSGATYTSEAYRQSMQSILDQL